MEKKFGDLTVRELRDFCVSAGLCDNCILSNRYNICAEVAIMNSSFDERLLNKKIEVLKNESEQC